MDGPDYIRPLAGEIEYGDNIEHVRYWPFVPPRFPRELVICVEQIPIPFGPAWRTVAQIRGMDRVLNGLVSLSYGAKSLFGPAGRKALSRSPKPPAAELPSGPHNLNKKADGFLAKIRGEFGHVAIMLRHDGKPQELHEGIRLLGFYPHFLARRKVGGRLERHVPMDDYQRIRRIVSFNDVVDGHIGDDDDLMVTAAIAVRLDDGQYREAPILIRSAMEGAAYHAWGIHAPNCALKAFHIADKLCGEQRVPPELRHPLPRRIIAAIEQHKARGGMPDGIHCFDRADMAAARQTRPGIKAAALAA